jgi:hypothetical protein
MNRRSGSGVPGLFLGLGAAAALLLLTACAQEVDSPGGASASAGATSSESATPEPSGTSSGGLPLATDIALEPGRSGRGLPQGVAESMDSAAGVAWSPEPGLLYVVTYGSSSCPSIAEAEATAADAGVTVTLLPPDPGMCTMDWAPTTTVVAVPAGTDETVPMTVVLGEHGTVEVPPRTTDGQPGEVAWAGIE